MTVMHEQDERISFLCLKLNWADTAAEAILKAVCNATKWAGQL